MHGDSRLTGRPVAVLGLGIEGRDLSRFLRGRGAAVTVFDTRPRGLVASAAAEVESLGVEVRLGPLDPNAAVRFDALYVSQSVLVEREPLVLAMRELGRPVSSMMREFYRRWTGPIVGVTGSSGKTTTTSLVAAMFERAGVAHIVGGNIGLGLLGQLDRGSEGVWAILEVSHTQLQLSDRSPRIAAITNVTPNHLDQFDWEGYVRLKRNHVAHQGTGDVVVLNARDSVSRTLRGATPARAVWFNLPIGDDDAVYAESDAVVERRGGATTPLFPFADISLRGAHNVENVLAATAVARTAGIASNRIGAAVCGFSAVPHRLETVRLVDGVLWVNDSIATSPERTLAGIRSFGEPLVLLLGGRDKHLPLDELGKVAHRHARAIVCFGEAGALLEQRMGEAAPAEGERAAVVRCGSLAEAVAEAARRAQNGDVVLLSPACNSFDAYPNFERRGEEFRALVERLPEKFAHEDGT